MTTRYEQIADNIRLAIEEGRYKPGDKLPSENALIREHKVARSTARQAISVLIRDGFAIPKRGSGTFVTTPDAYTWEDCTRDLALLTPLTRLQALEVTFDMRRIQAGDPEDLLPLLVAIENAETRKFRSQAVTDLLENVINWRDDAADDRDETGTR